jgi:hypothetical protein
MHRCTKVKQETNHGAIYLLINRLTAHIKIMMTVCANGSLDGLGLVHAKLLESVMSILGLAYKRVIFQMLDLKIKKVFEFSHHRHLKHIDHDLAKLIIKKFISRAKNDIINIYLVYK